VLVLGDSLSAGYGLSRSESWTSLLQQRINESGRSYKVVNASISGDTTRGGVARLPRSLKIHQPALVVIELGGNDGLRGIPPEEIRQNLAEMVRLSRESGATVLLTGMLIPPNYGTRYTERFLNAFRQVSEDMGVPLTPFLLEDIALEPGMMQDDGIHPTAAAQPLILDKLWPWIEPLLGPPPES
jgi:acyl-CoA thioesterase-1